MATRHKYLRTELPALLTEALTVTLDDYGLDQLNAYRRARHAYLSAPAAMAPEEGGRLLEARLQAAEALAGYVAFDIRQKLGEPDDFE